MINNWGASPFPNGAKIIGLLAYDTPYFSIDRDFIKYGLRTMTKEPLSSAYHMYASKYREEKSTRRRVMEHIALKVVKTLNFVVTELMNDFGELVVRTFIAAAILICAFAFYVYKELDHDEYEVSSELDNLENCIVLPGSPYDDILYGQKVYDYMTFSLENFRSEDNQYARYVLGHYI